MTAPSVVRVLLRPRMLLLHTAGVLAVLATTLLGQWQLGAWQGHREERSATLAEVDPVPLGDVLGPDDAFPPDAAGQPVRLAGSWVTAGTVLVSDRPHDGDSGVWVVTPLAVCGAGACEGAPAVPVVVGWATEQEAKEVQPPSGTVEAVGWLQPGEQSTEAADLDGAAFPVLGTLRISDLLASVDQDLYGGYVILDTPASTRGALQPVTPDSLPKPPASTALRNLLYAVQWWVFGAFAVFVWLRWAWDEVAATRRTTQAPDVTDAPATEEGEAPIPSER